MEKLLFSSISKKFVMALAGIFLLFFLPVHLYVNSLLLKDDPQIFNRAAHFLANFPIVRIIEVLLILSLLVHIIWGLIVQINNWMMRPVAYVKGNKTDTSFFSRFMIWTGGSVMIFLGLHFSNFFFIKLGIVPGNPEDFYTTAHNLFSIPAYNYIYITSFIILGLHLYHAIVSATQTLGLSNRFWTPVIKGFAVIYAIFIPSGFAFISVSLWLFR